MNEEIIDKAIWAQDMAWPRRSELKVGCCVWYSWPNEGGDDEYSYAMAGNIEHLWQASTHAEELAIYRAIGDCLLNDQVMPTVHDVCVVAEREMFAPCGGCLDLIMEFGGKECRVLHYNPATQETKRFLAKELMPFYPTRT